MAKLVQRGLLLSVLVLVLLLVAGATTVLADGYHVVCAGETLYAIGRRYGVNPYTIASANGLANPNYIRVGQVLYIPSSSGWNAPRPQPHQPSQPHSPPQQPSQPRPVHQPQQPVYSQYQYFNYWYCQNYGCPNYYWGWYQPH